VSWKLRPLTVVIYAAFLGLLLASYVAPLQDIIEARAAVSALEQRLQSAQTENTANKRLIEELNTPAGIERAARERYGMILPGEKVYIIPSE
jgi:cell division protein FtsB